MAEALLSLSNVAAGYGEARAISGIDLTLAEGRSLAILGRNGTGKTTLVNTIIGVTRLMGGTIRFGGRDITALRPDIRARSGIGWVPQERNIFKSLTVEENLSAVALPGRWDAAAVYRLFPRLAERKANLGNQLSGGEQQMLAIGRALVLNPRLLLLDEPTEGLAPIIIEELLAALKRIIRDEGLSAIIIEQQAHKILGVTDDAIILDRGVIVHAAASAALIADSAPLDLHLGVTRKKQLDRSNTHHNQQTATPRGNTMTMRTKPPFRADQVGSLLRSARLHEARAKHEKGEITAAALKAVEDEEIIKVIAKQESVGLQGITDGEFRRAYWHLDFLKQLDGVEAISGDSGMNFKGGIGVPYVLRIVDKVGYGAEHPMVEHFRFLKAHTKKTPKMTIPGPSMLHYRGGRKMMNPGIYNDMDGFYSDVGGAYAGAVADFYKAGCRYLQLDDISFAYLCDPEQREMLRARGDDPEAQQGIYAGMVRKALADKPADLTITMHLCRGNFRSTFIASGGYEPVAETLFNAMPVDGYFMEWDTDRAGGFEPLRFLPKGKHVVLGLVTTKTGALEASDDIKRRIEEASKFVSLDQLCLSPQCGFASTQEGNSLAEDEQWKKMEMIVRISQEVWGKSA